MDTREDVKVNVVVNFERRIFSQLVLYDPQGVEYDNRFVHWSYDRGNNCESALSMCLNEVAK